jgi:hypothetical protein
MVDLPVANIGLHAASPAANSDTVIAIIAAATAAATTVCLSMPFSLVSR